MLILTSLLLLQKQWNVMKIVEILQIPQIITYLYFITLLQFFKVKELLITRMQVQKPTMMLLTRKIRLLEGRRKCLLVIEFHLILYSLHITHPLMVILYLPKSIVKILPHIPRTTYSL